MLIRTADESDADQACLVLQKSIQELCSLDHRGDEQTLQAWLRNKTPENVRSWIRSPDQRLVVAEDNGNIVGVGGASRTGEITLNYVSPSARFKGISKAVLAALEAYLRDTGNAQSKLTSTQTAHSFYISAGYVDAGEPELWGKLQGQPMSKVFKTQIS